MGFGNAPPGSRIQEVFLSDARNLWWHGHVVVSTSDVWRFSFWRLASAVVLISLGVIIIIFFRFSGERRQGRGASHAPLPNRSCLLHVQEVQTYGNNVTLQYIYACEFKIFFKLTRWQSRNLLSHLIDFFTDVKDSHKQGDNLTESTQEISCALVMGWVHYYWAVYQGRRQD